MAEIVFSDEVTSLVPGCVDGYNIRIGENNYFRIWWSVNLHAVVQST